MRGGSLARCSTKALCKFYYNFLAEYKMPFYPYSSTLFFIKHHLLRANILLMRITNSKYTFKRTIKKRTNLKHKYTNIFKRLIKKQYHNIST
jgi:hypothetical protein